MFGRCLVVPLPFQRSVHESYTVQNTFDEEILQIFHFQHCNTDDKKDRSGAYFVFQEHNIESKVYTFYKIIFNVSI